MTSGTSEPPPGCAGGQDDGQRLGRLGPSPRGQRGQPGQAVLAACAGDSHRRVRPASVRPTREMRFTRRRPTDRHEFAEPLAHLRDRRAAETDERPLALAEPLLQLRRGRRRRETLRGRGPERRSDRTPRPPVPRGPCPGRTATATGPTAPSPPVVVLILAGRLLGFYVVGARLARRVVR